MQDAGNPQGSLPSLTDLLGFGRRVPTLLPAATARITILRLGTAVRNVSGFMKDLACTHIVDSTFSLRLRTSLEMRSHVTLGKQTSAFLYLAIVVKCLQ